MSLNRYFNRELIVELNNPEFGLLYDKKFLGRTPYSILIPDDLSLLNNSTNLAEVHIYSFYGDHIASTYKLPYVALDAETKTIVVDISKVFNDARITRGSFIITVNLVSSVWGNVSNRPVEVTEISPDRTELRLEFNKLGDAYLGYNDFISKLSYYKKTNQLNNLIANFGDNQLYNILNWIQDPDNPNVLYLKLNRELDEDLDVGDTAWFDYELTDPYCDTVKLIQPESVPEVNQLKGPNFFIETDLTDSNATNLLSWDELLDSDTPTTQNIIDATISGSNTATLNIDYTSFDNFIFYSSAEERIKNFQYKIQQIELYSASNADLNNSSGSGTTYTQQTIDLNNSRADAIRNAFDPFERWLYYHTTSSLFTHDISGSITPWPKYLYNGKWELHKTNSALGTAWYDNTVVSASAYDETNYNRLYWSVPEHIIMNTGNSDYMLFVDMVGQHFDNIHAYVNALNDIHKRDEHPERAISNDLIYHAARSFGWKLQDVRQLSALWLYKLGTDNSGSYASTGSMFSLPHEQQTKQVWRRILNNLPYLLKTKGTSRSVKALMSIYGIPQTLISIKEYGGPGVEANKPAIIEDRFFYQAKMTGSNYIQLPRQQISSTSGSWTGDTRVPDTIEFRFRTNYSSSVSMSLWAIEDGDDRSLINGNLELYHITASTGTSSFSGSYAYGYLKYTGVELSGSYDTTLTRVTSSVTSPYLPLFDNDNWTVRVYTQTPLTSSNSTGSIKFQVARTKDCLGGRTLNQTTFEWTGSGYDKSYGWGHIDPSNRSFPIAAFALHDIGGLGTNYVRTRRSSDNAEADFTAPEILDGTMTDWVNEEVIIYTSDFTSGNEDLFEVSGIGTDGETIAGVSDVYRFTLNGGLTNHRTGIFNIVPYKNTYTLTVDYYIPSTNSKVDSIWLSSMNGFGSDLMSGPVDTWNTHTYTWTNTTISAYDDVFFMANDSVGATYNIDADGDVFYLKNIVVTQTTADGLVTTWYDQSGQDNHATQAIASQQPKIVDAGSLITSNGYNVIQYDGVDDNLTIANIQTSGSMLMGGSDGSAFYEVDISGSYDLIADANNTDHPLNETIRVIWDRTIYNAEQLDIESDIDYTDWDFSDITSFFEYWQDRSELTSFPLIDTSNGTSFAYAWSDCSSLTSFPLIDTSSGTNFFEAWQGCSSLTSFPLINTSSGTLFSSAWRFCSSLTSFPLIDTSSGTNFGLTWQGCSSLTSFPLIDTSSGTSFASTWRSCTSLTSFPLIDTSSGTDFNFAWYQCSSLTSFPLIDTSSGTNFSYTWYGCSSLTSFPLINTSSGTSFSGAWYGCSSLTSFPLINTSSGTNFREAWGFCSSLTSFPLIDTSSGTDFTRTWRNCTSLTSFPLIDTSSVTSFTAAWVSCSSLTSFPLIDTSSGTNFLNTWYECLSLTTIPANMFDSCPATNFTGAFQNTNLTSQSIENIVVSIDTAGQSNGTLDISGGGNATTATAQTAIDNLRGKGWTVTVPDGY